MEILTHSVEETKQAAKDFFSTLLPKGEAVTVGLSGNLGAGKTEFVRAIIESLGVSEPVTSPTFVLEKIYRLPEGNKFKQLIHIDAYRLTEEDNLKPLALEEIFAGPENVVFIEWPENIRQALPGDMIEVGIEHVDEGVRKIIIQF